MKSGELDKGLIVDRDMNEVDSSTIDDDIETFYIPRQQEPAFRAYQKSANIMKGLIGTEDGTNGLG